MLVSPTTPTTAFKLGERVDDPLAMYLADLCTIPSNLYGGPAMSVPCGLSDDGLPVGFQVMAPVLADDRLYRVGAALESALNSARCSTRSGSGPASCASRAAHSGAQDVHRPAANVAVEPVDVELAVEVAALVLQAARHQPGAFDADRRSRRVDAFDCRVVGAAQRKPQAGKRQAALVAVLLAIGRDELRVDDDPRYVVDEPAERAQADADLVGGEAGAALASRDGVEQVPAQRCDRVVEDGDLVAGRAQDGIAPRRISRSTT